MHQNYVKLNFCAFQSFLFAYLQLYLKEIIIY